MLKQSKKFFLFIASLFVIHSYALATQTHKTHFKEESAFSLLPSPRKRGAHPAPLRPLDLEEFKEFYDAVSVPVPDGPYGNQFGTYGRLHEIILRDLRNFPAKANRTPLYVEVAAGLGFLPLYLFQHTAGPVHFIVNDLSSKNLSKLQALLVRSTKTSTNRGMKDSFTIIPGDCMTLTTTPAFEKAAPEGVDFISALNLVHFMSPKKVIHLFAHMSDKLRLGGKFYVMHDINEPKDNNLFVSQFLTKFSKEKYDKVGPTIFNFNFNQLRERPEAIAGLYFFLREYLTEEQKRSHFEFPGYRSHESTHEIFKNLVVPHEFELTPAVIIDVAQAVGFKLVEKGGIYRLARASGLYQVENVSEDKANSLWYVFEKDKTNPLKTPVMDSTHVKDLLRRAELAKQQRKGFTFKRLPYHPFVEAIPGTQRDKNDRLRRVSESQKDNDKVTNLLSDLQSLPSLSDLNLREETPVGSVLSPLENLSISLKPLYLEVGE